MSEFNLEDLRKQIDEIDSELLELFKKRMEVVDKINQTKQNNNLPTTCTSREKEIFDNLHEKYKNEYFYEYMIEFEKDLIILSKEYQKNKN